MGLNLETLIGILVILILLILADGVRRMVRERHGRLRMRIDRRFGKGSQTVDNDGGSDYSHELGKPRVRSSSERAARGEHADIDTDTVDLDGGDPHRAEPPMVMDPSEPPAEPAPRRAEQQPLFDADADDEPRVTGSAPQADEYTADAPEPEAKPEAKPEPKPRPQPEPERPRARAAESQTRPPKEEAPVLEVIVFHLIARRPDRFDGQAMLRLLLENGLRYGEMHIFHRHRQVEGREQLEFSVANAVEPGTFDIDTMEEEGFAGITFFMKLPGPKEPLVSLDRMLTVGRRLAEEMDGDLKDEQHSVLTPQTMEHLRQRVQEFERRQRVSHGA